MDKDRRILDLGQQLLKMQGVARELERERDDALAREATRLAVLEPLVEALKGCPHCDYREDDGSLVNHCARCCWEVTSAAYDYVVALGLSSPAAAERDAARFSLTRLRAEIATLEDEITRDHACIAAMREQLALRDARVAALEEAVRHLIDDARPAPSPGSAIVGNHAITGLKNAMYVGAAPSCERGQG